MGLFISYYYLLGEKSDAITELPYSSKKREHPLSLLKSFFSSDTRQSMKRRIKSEM